jgi:hypothetical protein
MHGEGEEIRLVAQAVRCTVALMDIEIDDEGALDRAIRP